MWDCGRATIYRKVNAGALSLVDVPGGGRGVDTSEMLRVFGPAVSSDVQPDAMKQTADGVKQQADADLRRENEHLRDLLEAKNEHIETLKHALLLLEHKQPAQDQGEDTAAVVAAIMERTRAEAAELAEELAKAKVEASKLAEIETELERARQESAELAQRLEAERNRGFFAKLFGR